MRRPPNRRAGPLLRALRISAVLALLLGLAACANKPRTSFDRDENADMSRYATYAWIKADSLIAPGEGESRQMPYLSPIDDQRIRQALKDVMQDKGYREVADTSDADLIVSYSVGSQERLDVTGTGWGWGGVYGDPYYYPYGRAGVAGTTNVRQYTEGTLAIEFWDRQTKRAVWVGWASERLRRHSDRDNERIGQAVIALLEPFPEREVAGASDDAS